MYAHVVLGGTFDHLHAGHEDLLRTAFMHGKKVTLGLTKSSMNRKKLAADQILPFAIREKEIKKFAASIDRSKDLYIVPIKDIYGTTLVDATLEAIIVTPHTNASAQQIDKDRQAKGLSALKIETCPLHRDTAGEVLSSSRIRQGICDRQGNLYADFFVQDVHLSERAKEQLRKPWGKAAGARKLRDISTMVIMVGDVVTEYCVQHAVPFSVAFIDGVSKKKKYVFSIPDMYVPNDSALDNPAGTITSKVAEFLRQPQKRNTIQSINGEEDLVTVAAVLLSPIGTIVGYGYPYHPQSLRIIRVSDKMKQKFLSIIKE